MRRLLLVAMCLGLSSVGMGGDDVAKPAPEEKKPALQPLNPTGTVLLDAAGKRVLLKTKVALREGALELFCCLKQTKEHESILTLDAKAFVVHTGLIALKAKPGAPAKYDPEFVPPTGQPLTVHVSWIDSKGATQRVPASSWVRYLTRRFFVETMEKPADLKIPEKSELRYDNKHKELAWYGPMTDAQKTELLAYSKDKAYKAAIESFHKQGQSREMEAKWVFAGSGYYNNPEGKKYYLAEDGDLISVSNFAGATIDVAIRSSNDNGSLLFEAWTERIPPEGTEVTIEISPVEEKSKELPDPRR
jgi:hypothetical protein